MQFQKLEVVESYIFRDVLQHDFPLQIMDEEEAKLSFKQICAGQDDNKQIIREFKQKTNLSLRQIAAITGINKDKVNKFLRDD